MVKMDTKEHIVIFAIQQDQRLLGPLALLSAQMVSTIMVALNLL
jgi:hypothetical protein